MNNFSLSLYAFHLRHSLTELPGEVVQDANLLWENLVTVGENLPEEGRGQKAEGGRSYKGNK